MEGPLLYEEMGRGGVLADEGEKGGGRESFALYEVIAWSRAVSRTNGKLRSACARPESVPMPG